jgi:hypothetical protein
LTEEKREAKRQAISGILKHREAIWLLLKEYFNKEAIQAVSSGRLRVSEDVIRSELMHIDKVKAVIKEFHCDPDGMLIRVQPQRLGVKIDAQVRLRILELKVTESTQTLVLQVTEAAHPIGQNLLGKIVCGIGRALVGNLSTYALKNCDLGDYLSYSDHDKLITVRLDKIPNVRTLLTPRLPTWEDSVPLRLIGVENATHVDKAIEMSIVVSPALKLAGKTLAPVLDAGKRKVPWFSKNRPKK